MIELLSSRTNKLAPAPGGRRRFAVYASVGARWMIDERGILHTIDPLKPETLPYVPEIGVKDGMPWFHYKSKQVPSGEFFVSMKGAYRGSTLAKPNFKDPVEIGNQTIWYDFYPGVDVIITKGLTSMSLRRLIKNGDAPLVHPMAIEAYPGIAQLVPLRPAYDADGEPLEMVEKAIYGGRTETLILPEKVKWPVLDSTEIEEQVEADLDDGWSDSTGTHSSGGSYLQVGYYLGKVYDSWHRFTNISGLSGSEIDVAHIELYGAYGDMPTPFTTIYAEYHESPTVPESQADHAGRDRTSEGTVWNSLGLSTSAFTESPSIVDVIQELADNFDPDVIQILHDGGTGSLGVAYPESHDHDPAQAALLYIEYTEGGGPTQQAVGGGAIAIAATIGRKIAVSRGAGSITPTGTLSSVLSHFLDVGSGSVTIAGTVGRNIAVSVGAGAVSIAGLVGRTIKTAVGAGAVALSGVLSTKHTVSETLRPDGAGSEANLAISGTEPAGTNWESVDEASPDEAVTYVCTLVAGSTNFIRDLYATQNSSPSGTIQKITVYARGYQVSGDAQDWLKIEIKSGETNANSLKSLPSGPWTTVSQDWATNPDDSEAWDWADIDALQIGVSLYDDLVHVCRCTQVYVVVTYEAPTVFYQLVGEGAVAMAGALAALFRYSQIVGSGAISIAGVLGRKIKVGVGAGAVASAGTAVLKRFASVGGGALSMSNALGRKIRVAVGSGAVAMAGWGRGYLARILSIFKSKGTDLTITSTLSTDLTITPALSTDLTITSTLEAH